ncbi:MAG: phage major capsid protein [Chloroflexota bacterium]|nr:phage major capsid protein [Chloroflexota bacterium]
MRASRPASTPSSASTSARRTIAHLTEPIPRQQLDDAELLRQFVESELRYGLMVALDNQILNGNGTGENLRGILNTTGIQTVTTGADALVRARAALTLLQVSDLEPTAYVLSPTDWATIEGVAAAQFAANPGQPTATDAMQRRLYGVPVPVSNAIANGTGLLGAFSSSSELGTTQEVRIDWSEQVYDPNAFGAGDGASDFERNLIRFRAEGRWGLAITRPDGFVRITFGA